MKKILSPVALISAAALIVAACSSETSTGPSKNLVPRADVNIASAGTAQVCLDGSSPTGGRVYSVDLTFGGDNTGDNLHSTPAALTPGNCIDADIKNPADVGPSFPIATVLSSMGVNEIGGSWTWTCVSNPDAPTFCPDGASGTDNDANSWVSGAHGTTVTYTYTPPPYHPEGCTYSQGFYKNHQSSVSSVLSGGGTYITAGKLDVSGGLDKNLGTAGDNTLTASQIVNLLKPANAPADFRQLITAELNVASGASVTGPVQDAIDGLRDYYAGTSYTKQQIGAWTSLLDSFNNGLVLGAAPHCGDNVV